jgi:uncharacterized protein YjbI with pentapeptide repeats/endonuclease YncB( thermonuclease family)
MVRLSLVMLAFSLIAVGVVLVFGVGWPATGVISAAGVFIVGLVLWWNGTNTQRKWDEIGRTIMVSVLLAALVGVLQYAVDQRQKERDFELSLTLQDNLAGVDLQKRNLAGMRLQGKNLVEADLRGATLNNVNLIGADLSHADLDGAELRDADLRKTNLDGASLAGADLRNANLKTGDLPSVNLRDADLRGANLEITNLRGACLAEADLRGTKMAGADLRGGVLTGADVRGTIFESDLRPARLREAGLADVTYDRTTAWPLDFAYGPAVEGLPPPALRLEPRRPDDLVIPARVVDVVDGDTLRMEASSETDSRLPEPGRTRLIGVNTPDLDDPGGHAAKRFVEQNLEGRQVDVQLGSRPIDDGQRYLIYVWLSDRSTFNEHLLDSGHAELQLKENHEFERPFAAAALRAKQRGSGLWRHCPKPE